MKIKFLTLTIVFLSTLVLGLVENISAETNGSVHWTYTGETGPTRWGDLSPMFSMCKKGRSQSPINITGTERKNDDQIAFHYGSSPFRLVNNGHTIQSNSNAQSYIQIKGKKFSLLQFHFHSPSEHRINGRRYGMELHFVHKNTIGQLAVIAVLLKKGKENYALNKLWDYIPYEVNREKVVGTKIEAADFLPRNGSYYHYMGSLTTPPCSEGVNWYVLKSSIEVSQNQINKFTNLIRFNARPVQPLNGRVINAVYTGQTSVIQLVASPSSGHNASNNTSAGNGQTQSAGTMDRDASQRTDIFEISVTTWILGIGGLLILGILVIFMFKSDLAARILSRLRLRSQIVGLVIILSLLMILIGGIAIFKMKNIGQEIEGISKRDIPLTNVVTEITKNQLLQAVWFERAFRYGEMIGAGKDVKEDLSRAEDKFLDFERKTNEEIQKAEGIAKNAIKNANTKLAREEFKAVFTHLKKVKDKHKVYSKHVEKAFRLLNDKEFRQMEKKAAEIEDEQVSLNSNLEEFLKRIEKFTAQATNIARKDEKEAMNLIIVASVFSILLGLIIGLIVSKGVLRQLGGEPAEMARIAQDIAEGDLTLVLSDNGKADTGIYSAMKHMLTNLKSIMTALMESSSQLSATSEEINAAATNLSEGSQNQAANVEETSASTEELVSNIGQVSDHAIAMKEKSDQSLEEAQAYKEDMAKVTEEMMSISVSTEKIGDIIKVINDIADQTNLLSLNAAIEAARAGEHGRGFAVVAEAISTLATRSADSTKEIEALIKDSIARISQGVDSVKKSNDSFNTIIEAIDVNNKLVNEITRSMEEQRAGSEQIQKATENINNSTQTSSSSAEELAASTTELHELAEKLNGIVNTFRINENTSEKDKKLTQGVMLTHETHK